MLEDLRAKRRAAFAALFLLLMSAPLRAATAPPLGYAGYFTVLSGNAILKGASSIQGNAAVYPGSEVQGLRLGVLKGFYEARTLQSSWAQDSLRTAKRDMAGQPCETKLQGVLADISLMPGSYCADKGLTIMGKVTLDAMGNPDAVFTFNIGGELRAKPLAQVLLANGAGACNIYWNAGSAVIESEARFAGSILAAQSIALEHGAFLEGRALARDGEILFNKNQVSACPTPAVTEKGRLIGNGRILPSGRSVYTNFDLQCNMQEPQNLEISWGKNKFRLVATSTVSCMDDPSMVPNPSQFNFDVMLGQGTGDFNGRAGYRAQWTFADQDDSGKLDFAEVIVRTRNGKQVLSAAGRLSEGNFKAYPDSIDPLFFRADSRPNLKAQEQ